MEEALARCGATLSDGLDEAALDEIEGRYSFEFAPDHRVMLGIAVPVGERWPAWRGESAAIQERLNWPITSIVFDVEHNLFWHPDWGDRPDDLVDAMGVARSRLAEVPRLAPLYGHRYLPTVPHEPGNPVLSCYQTDIIYYGTDLLDWFDREFPRPNRGVIGPIDRHLPFWSWFLE